MLKHRLISSVPDNLVAGLIKPSHWNDSLVVSGSIHGALLLRDTGDADGHSFLASVAAGQVLASAGVGALPAFTASPSLTAVRFPLTDPPSPQNGDFWMTASGSAPGSYLVRFKIRHNGVTLVPLEVTL